MTAHQVTNTAELTGAQGVQDIALNVASQCRATASSALAETIVVDAGSGLLRELLIDAAKTIESLTTSQVATAAEIDLAIKAARADGTIHLTHQSLKVALQAIAQSRSTFCSLGCIEECKAKLNGYASKCPAIPLPYTRLGNQAFGGCPQCGRADCVARSCATAAEQGDAKDASPERELQAWWDAAVEQCALMLDRDADRQEALWEKYVMSDIRLPATTYHTIPREYAKALRVLKGQTPTSDLIDAAILAKPGGAET